MTASPVISLPESAGINLSYEIKHEMGGGGVRGWGRGGREGNGTPI